MKKYLLVCLFFCVAYAAGHKIVTVGNFSEVEMGINEKELKSQLGDPYSTKKFSNGEKEFEYIERIIADDRTIQIRHYFFIIKDGIVISKRIVEGEKYKPLLERNAYDLQTSYNEKF